MSAACRSTICRAIEGRSNYTLRRLIRLWLSMFLNFSVMPLRLATLFGLGFGALGALAAVIVVVEAIISDKPPQGWASLMVAVLVLAGVQLVVVGLIGEYLGRMFLAVNRKPQYLVREVFRRGAGGLEVERPQVDTQRGGPAAPRAVSRGVLSDDGLLRGAGHRHPGRHRAARCCSRPAPMRRTS